MKIEFLATFRKDLATGEILGITLTCRACLHELDEAKDDREADAKAQAHLHSMHAFITTHRKVRNYDRERDS
jgi:hypothetical protein